WIVSSLFALTLIALRRFDEAFVRTRMGTALCALGTISYSLYLTHDFNVRLVQTLGAKLVARGLPEGAALCGEIAVLCGIATIFWFFAERPFLNKRPATLPAADISPNLLPARPVVQLGLLPAALASAD